MKNTKSKFSRFVAGIFAAVLTLGSAVITPQKKMDIVQAATAQPVEINETNFPDPNFRAIISGKDYDRDGNGILDAQEIGLTINIYCEGKGIKSLKGVEYFVDLQGLWCKDNEIETMDISNLKDLRGLWCSGNKFTSLDLSANPELMWVYCYDCKITTLNVANNPKMAFIECNTNPLTGLDVTHNPELEHLTCGTCELTSLDLSNNPKLSHLDAFSNKLTSLDVSHNPKLKRLDIWNNPGLGSIDISKNPGLQYYNCAYNGATSVDVSHNPELQKLTCSYNDIHQLDIFNNPKLVYLDAAVNQLASLDISQNPRLYYLQVFTNPFTQLDISQNPFLVKTYKEGVKKDESAVCKGHSWTIDYGGNTSTGGDNIFFLCFDDAVNLTTETENVISGEEKLFTNVTGSTLVLKKGKTFKLKPNMAKLGKKVKYKSSAPKKVKVTGKGTLKALKKGKAKLTISGDAASSKKILNVIVGTPVKKVTLNKSELGGKVGDKLKIKASVSPKKASVKKIKYISSDEKIATVDAKGNIKLLSEGEAKITAVSMDGHGKNASAKVTVREDVSPSEAKNLITREQAVQTLYVMAGSPSVSGKTRFTDVQKGAWYEKAILWGEKHSICIGYPDASSETFGVGRYVKRQDLALMLMRYSELMNYKRAIDFGRSDDYIDYYDIDYYAWEAICWSATWDIMSGKGAPGAPKNEQKIDPHGRATKAEFEAMLSRLFEVNGIKATPSIATRPDDSENDASKAKAPAKVTLDSIKNTNGKELTAKWKKASGAKGYEVQYSTNKKFKKAKTKTTKKTSLTIKNLKKKTYYVRIRAYTLDASGKKISGGWSTVKEVKIKK